MPKWLLVAVVVIVGAIATSMIDATLGIDWSQYTHWQKIIHNIAMMTLGWALGWVAFIYRKS